MRSVLLELLIRRSNSFKSLLHGNTVERVGFNRRPAAKQCNSTHIRRYGHVQRFRLSLDYFALAFTHPHANVHHQRHICHQSGRGRLRGPGSFILLTLLEASDRCAQSSPLPRHQREPRVKCQGIRSTAANAPHRNRGHRASVYVPKLAPPPRKKEDPCSRRV